MKIATVSSVNPFLLNIHKSPFLCFCYLQNLVMYSNTNIQTSPSCLFAVYQYHYPWDSSIRCYMAVQIGLGLQSSLLRTPLSNFFDSQGKCSSRSRPLGIRDKLQPKEGHIYLQKLIKAHEIQASWTTHIDIYLQMLVISDFTEHWGQFHWRSSKGKN